jgi:hypothetical protein
MAHPGVQALAGPIPISKIVSYFDALEAELRTLI